MTENKELNKHSSYGAAFALVVILALLAVGAMFFTDDIEDIFDPNKPQMTQAMELRGKWLGINLASMDSTTALRWGVPPSARGVMVVEVNERNGWRALQAGVLEGDIIVAVDGKKIRDLADLYDVSRNLDVGSAVLLDIRRWGQPITLVLPAVYKAPPVAAPAQAGQVGQPAPMTAQGATAGGGQPVAWITKSQGPQFYCSQHNRAWSQNAVHPQYRCPLGNCPLNRVR